MEATGIEQAEADDSDAGSDEVDGTVRRPAKVRFIFALPF